MKSDITVIIPTYKPTFIEIKNILLGLNKQDLIPEKIIIFDTKSEIKIDEMLKKIGNLKFEIELRYVDKSEFSHGKTRDQAISLVKTKYFLLLTQDVIINSKLLLSSLKEKFSDNSVAVTYARQLPRKEAKLKEKYFREFNYPDKDRIQEKSLIKKLGIKTYFLSDTCAMYDREKYNKVGGFSYNCKFAEDMDIAYRFVNSGYKVYYNSKATIVHSHNYSYIQQFKRNMEIGKEHKRNRKVYKNVSADKEGIKLLKNSLNYYFVNKKLYCYLDFLIDLVFRFVGQKIGVIIG